MRILLVSDVPPCDNFTGGIILKHLCNFLIDEGHNLDCFIVADPLLKFDIPGNILKKINYYRVNRPVESWGQGKFGFLSSLIMNNYYSLLEIPKIAQKCAEFIKKNKIDKVWFVVQGQTTINLVRRVLKITKLPFCVEIWDPPEWWINDKKFDKLTSRIVMSEFGRVLHEADSCITTSDEMAKEYGEKYNANCISMMPGSDTIRITKNKNKNKNEFVIAVTGQIYATEEFQSLINALVLKKWRILGKKIILRIYGKSFDNFYLNKPANIEVRGWLSSKELLREITKVDLLYCPYFFAEMYAYISRLSFPSKLATYLSTGVPVLFHGPNYSSPYIFLNKYKAGYFCETINPKAISKCITNIIKDKPVNKRKIFLNAKKAFSENLTFKSMKKKFFNALFSNNEKK